MQAVMSMDQVTNMVPSSITWRDPVEVNQAGDGDPVGPGTNRVSPAVSPAGDDHLSDGDTPASQQKITRTRFSSGGSLGQGLTSSSSSPNLLFRDQDQSATFMETTQIIGKQARLQEKPHSSGVPESSVMPLVSDSPGSPHASRQTLRSRARPRRPEEPPPFLSIDNLPVDKIIVDSKQHSRSRPSSDSRKHTASSKKRQDPLLNGSGRKTRSPPQSAYTPQMQRSPSRTQSRGTPSATQYNYNSFFTHKSSAFLAGPPNLWSVGNKYWPQHGTPNDRQRLAPLPQSVANETLAPKPNAHVSQPFKHDIDAEVPIDRPVSPSQDLKERTIYALREVTRVLNKQQSPPVSRRGGRLLKGRLKPLHTFKMSGPGVDTCKGIQPEETDHEPSDSRMLQRKRELLSMLPPDIFQPRPLTAESVHRTSIASQLSTERENDLEEQTLKTEGTPSQDHISGGSQVLSGVRMPPNSLASLSEDNVSFLQDALTSHIDIPETSSVKGEADDPQEERSDTQEDQSRIHPISHTYATSYESNSKVDITSQQAEELSASGDAPPVIVKDEDGEDGSVTNEVKATMSDYMNEGGAAMVLSDMVQRVANSAKKSTVDDDGDLDQKYDAYFADSETRSETPTSRTGSSTLGRRRSSMDDSEIDQASCELTDMVSDDGLGEDGSVKHAVKESDLERGSLSTLREESLSMIQDDKTAISEPECQSRDNVTPTNESFQKNSSNVAERLSVDNLMGVNYPVGETSASVDNKPSEKNSLDKNVEHSAGNLVGVELNQESVGATVEPTVNSNCTDEDTKDRTGSMDMNNCSKDHNNAQTESVANDAPSDVNAIKTDSSSPVESNGDISEKTGNTLSEPKEDAVVSSEETNDVTPVVTVDAVPTVQVEVTGTEVPATSMDNQNTVSEQDARQEKPLKDDSDENETGIVLDDSSASNEIVTAEENSKEQSALPDDEKVTNEESNEDAQENTRDSCHSNHVRKDDDKDQDGSQGGSPGNGNCSSGGNNDSSNTNNEDGNENPQSDPPSGTDGSGTQQRTHGICIDDSINLANSLHLGSASPQEMLDRSQDSYQDIEDDVPDIDEAVLFCGLCGLDEDMCLCPHSTFNEKLHPKGRRLTTKSASAMVDSKHDKVTHRSFSASGSLQNRQQSQGPFESWIQQDEEEVSIQNHLIGEYQAIIKNPRQGGFSKELVSPRDGYMVLQGTGVRCETRQSQSRMRPVSSNKSSQPENIHRTDVPEERVKSCDTQPDQLECTLMSGDPVMNDTLVNQNKMGRPDNKVTTLPPSPEAESLAVVAKPLSKPRNPKDSGQPGSPLPAPLCFRINARPPPGYLYYFAYGADMNQNRMASYIGREADHRLWGVLFGFQLKFNKRGADLEAGGFANIAFSPESSVEGCVYLISPSELRMLDQHVGCPEFFTKAVLPVWMMNCAEPDDLGVAQYCVPALMYVAQDKWTLQQEDKHSITSDYSIRQCLKGADLLTPSYVQHISTLRVN